MEIPMGSWWQRYAEYVLIYAPGTECIHIAPSLGYLDIHCFAIPIGARSSCNTCSSWDVHNDLCHDRIRYALYQLVEVFLSVS